jgi:hypothetical protein
VSPSHLVNRNALPGLKEQMEAVERATAAALQAKKQANMVWHYF